MRICTDHLWVPCLSAEGKCTGLALNRGGTQLTVHEQILLSEIAHGRSGDKGNHANIAVIAYAPAGYEWVHSHLTSEAVERYFQSLSPSRVVRYEAPNLLAVNFVLYDVLAGGASRSLRSDTQGKTLALALLAMPIDRPPNLDEMRRTRQGQQT
jgi:hypothetical protein